MCISANPLSGHLVRSAQRLATRLQAEWIAAYIETPAHQHLSDEERARVVETLKLADQLGAETVTLGGKKVAEELINFARSRNITRIILGKPKEPKWKERLFDPSSATSPGKAATWIFTSSAPGGRKLKFGHRRRRGRRMDITASFGAYRRWHCVRFFPGFFIAGSPPPISSCSISWRYYGWRTGMDELRRLWPHF
ncbi:MAG: hypothetical protein LHV69_08140 [Elusimicrobia bacterium]|nr:hypothetical protein [Candidatus Obscuribacterium magneticum]